MINIKQWLKNKGYTIGPSHFQSPGQGHAHALNDLQEALEQAAFVKDVESVALIQQKIREVRKDMLDEINAADRVAFEERPEHYSWEDQYSDDY